MSRGSNISKGKRSSKESILNTIKEVHGDTYIYPDLDSYVNRQTKMLIVCRVHGDFYQTMANHLNHRKGCNKCGNKKIGDKLRMTPEEFISKAKEKHGDYYDYCEVDYINNYTKISIKCPDHGVFTQTPNTHLRGSGCAKCASCGFRNDKAAYLYILNSPQLTKVGITNHSVRDRCSRVKSSSGIDFKIFKEYYFEDGKTASHIEAEILKDLSRFYTKPDFEFSGSTECFYDVDINYLVSRIELKTRATNSSILFI